jgi:NAD(P)-dependent dehydrogenase (short-subunit alcohol dehydrogenase family)
MTQRAWLITAVSSGFGRELTEQVLDHGDRVVGTVRRLDTVADLVERHPETPANGLAPGDPARMAAAMIASVDQEPAPPRMMLGSQALQNTLAVLRERVAGFEAQSELAASTDFPPGEPVERRQTA